MANALPGAHRPRPNRPGTLLFSSHLWTGPRDQEDASRPHLCQRDRGSIRVRFRRACTHERGQTTKACLTLAGRSEASTFFLRLGVHIIWELNSQLSVLSSLFTSDHQRLARV